MANDFGAMQENAISYAREMQQRAQKKEVPKQENENPFCRSGCPVRSIFSGGDSDTLLLLALLLVIASDGGDRMLMLALLYIMT